MLLLAFVLKYTVHASLFFNTQLTLRFISVILTTVIAIVWLIFPVFLVIVLFVGMRWYYLKTAREVKRLEAIGKIWQLLIYIAQYEQIVSCVPVGSMSQLPT